MEEEQKEGWLCKTNEYSAAIKSRGITLRKLSKVFILHRSADDPFVLKEYLGESLNLYLVHF